MRLEWMVSRVENVRRVVVAGVVLLFACGLQAQSLRNVTYVGGTALQGNGLHGRVTVSSVNTLVFEGPQSLAIPYDHVISFESKTRKQVHVGLFTEGVWRLVAPWPEAKQLSVSFRDPEEHPQVVVFEMSKGDEALLVEVLKTRVSRPGAQQPPLERRTVAGRNKMAEQ